MNGKNTDALMNVYELLKEKYSLTLTNTASLNDDFTIDCPILVGKTHGRILYLYEYEGDFVLDVMDEAMTKGTHWHPIDVASAVEDIIDFMEGTEDYPMRDFGKSL